MTRWYSEVDLILCTDASVRNGNPGTGSYAYVALDADERLIYQEAEMIPQYPITNNGAEYWAIIKGLEFARDLRYVRSLEIRTDSLVAARQLRGDDIISSSELNHLAVKAWELIDQIDDVRIIFVPRRFNGYADALAKTPFAPNPRAAMRRLDMRDYDEMPEDWCEEME